MSNEESGDSQQGIGSYEQAAQPDFRYASLAKSATPRGALLDPIKTEIDGRAAMDITGYTVRHEDFGDGFETWAIYRTAKNGKTGYSVLSHVRDARSEEVALDIIEALGGSTGT